VPDVSSAADVLKKFKTIKTLPHIAIQLTQMFSDSRTSVRDIEEVIRFDPTLVLRVLKLINSAYYGLRHKVSSIADAIVYLGLDILRNMVVLEAVKDLIEKDVAGTRFSREKLWIHSAVVGITNQMISERIFKIKGDNAFLCGILHDIGIIVEDQVVPGMFEKYMSDEACMQMPLVEFERQTLGTDHAEIGYLLCKEWKLPALVCESIRNHHRDPAAFSLDNPSVTIQLSEYLASKLDYSAMQNQDVIVPPVLRQHMVENISEYKVILMDLPEEIAKARSIYQLDGETA
jgi:HD-like signal output (HDOD) protein